MANWAIVIGINEYWKPDANLRGAVSDAEKMAKWLMDQDGGNVPPRNLFLLTRAVLSANVAPHPNNRLSDARKDDLVTVIDQLINRSNGKGERFFFYFSGHGLINRQNFTDEQALVMADFTNILADKAIALRSIREFFQATEFAEQFFFIDACRNVLDWNKEFKIGEFPSPLAPDAARPMPSQFLLFATSPRLKAVELNEAGAFTEVLLAGLRGRGAAKIYNKTDDEYLVPVERLFDYVKSEVQKKKIVVSEPSIQPPIFQTPRSSVFEKNDDEPILARFDPQEVSSEQLEIYVEPSEIWQYTEVKITSEDGEYDERIRPVHNVPIILPREMPPMSYTVRAAAPNHEPEKRRWSFDLYEPVRLDIKLKAVAQNSSEEFIENKSIPIIGAGNVTHSFEDFPVDTSKSKNIGDRLKPAKLTVKSKDQLAPLEVTDSAGKFIAAGRGELTVGNLEPGFYRAKIVTPEGKTSEQVIELSAGELETLELDAPLPTETALFKTIVDRTDFNVLQDNTLHISETVGSMATAQLSTMMMLTGSIVKEHYGWSDRIESLGLPSFGEATNDAKSGVRIVFADESIPSEQQSTNLSQIGLRLWKQNEAIPENFFGIEYSSTIPNLAQFIQATEPGAYLLSVEFPNRSPAYFSLSILPERMTLLTIQQRADGGIRLFIFSPSTSIRLNQLKPKENSKNLRRLELLQRFHLSGRVDNKHSYQNAKELLYAKFIDPFAGCLGGYTMLQLDKADELEVAVLNMINLYGELSDSYVLAAEYYARKNYPDERVVDAYHTALEQGIPVFAEGLQLLIQGIEKFEITHPHAAIAKKAFNNRAPNTLLTVWTPSTSNQGDND